MAKNFKMTFEDCINQCLNGVVSENEVTDTCNKLAMHGEALVLSNKDEDLIVLIRRIRKINGKIIKNWWDVSNNENSFDIEDEDLHNYIHNHIEHLELKK